MTHRRWDIFCKAVDNYGDIGVCWRLALQLAQEFPNIEVRLFIDDSATVAKIIPQFLADKPSQIIQKVAIHYWQLAQQCDAEVVLETFSCNLPEAYLTSMQYIKPVWINLEYLSAEKWVGDFHAKPSLHPNLALNKYFYFPGFTTETGGLIREHDLLVKRDAFLAKQKVAHDSLKISLFCYPQAPIKSLFTALLAWAKNNQAIEMYIPFSNALCETLADLNDTLLDFNYKIGEVYTAKNFTIHVLPFLSQDQYDQLLWQCDINFVRGEDSWIRAIWAGKPFIWQPYIQTDNTHLIKLNAFLQTHFAYADDALNTIISNANNAWSAENIPQETFNDIWQPLFSQLSALELYCKEQTTRLSLQASLANQLVAFSENLLKNKV